VRVPITTNHYWARASRNEVPVKEDAYWQAIGRAVMSTRAWVRLVYRSEMVSAVTAWGQLLTVPTTGYLEVRDGPFPFRQVEAVDVAPVRVLGGGHRGAPPTYVLNHATLEAALIEACVSWSRISLRFDLPGVLRIDSLEALRLGAYTRKTDFAKSS